MPLDWSKTRCASCGRRVRKDQTVCECGAIYAEMSFDDRIEAELERWRAHRTERRA